MKRLKKVMLSLLCLSMLVMMMPTVAFAANAELRFSDPTAAAGGIVEVTARFSADDEITEAKATLSYDTSYLEFVSGEGASGGDGQVELSASGDGSDTEFNWTLRFQTLQEGVAMVEVLTATGTASNGTSVTVTKGTSTVTIEEGDGSGVMPISETTGLSSDGIQVDVNGTLYILESEFEEVLVPEGFSLTQTLFEGQTCNAAIQDASGKYVMYLTNPAGESNFFLYDPDYGTFTPFEQISISEERYIILLNEDMSSDLPSIYQKTSLTIDGNQFPAWQNAENADYYLVYALNSDGSKEFYQYDVVDATYQRHTPEAEAVEEEEALPDNLFYRILEKLKDYMDIFVIAVGVLFGFLLLVLLVVSVKLSHRNDELDYWEEKYGDIEDEEEALKAAKKKEQKAKKGKQSSGKRSFYEEDENDFERYEEDEYDDDDYEEEVWVERKPKQARQPQQAKQPQQARSSQSAKKTQPTRRPQKPQPMRQERTVQQTRQVQPQPQRRSHAEEDDTFKMDIIDLD